MRKITANIIWVFLLVSVLSCNKDTSPNPEFHFDYYPLETGRFVVYEAMEIRHDIQALIPRDTSKYLLKTVIGESIIDLEGDSAFVFYRYWKLNPEDEWVIKDVWTTKLKERRAELVEENQRIIKLVFAPTANKVWNMNELNADQNINVRYDAEWLHKTININGLTFESTIRVNQRDFFSLVDHRKQYEVYAKGVGLVHKFYKNNDILNFDTLNIRFGHEIHYRAIDFGLE